MSERLDRFCAFVAYDVLPFWLLISPMAAPIRRRGKRYIYRNDPPHIRKLAGLE